MAHRLRTVIDYDRLIVLDKGQVRVVVLMLVCVVAGECDLTELIGATQIAEIDTPWNLINKSDGIFRGMCLKSGSFGELELAAKEKAMLLD